MTVLTVADLTQTTLNGTGVFDALMRANKAHLDAEFDKNRIKGSEYATVYLGSLAPVLQTALQFLLQKDELALKAQLLAQQIILAGVEVQKAQAELLIIQASVLKVPAEVALLQAQATHTLKQVLVADEEILLKKQQVLVSIAEVGIAQAKLTNIPKEGLHLDAQTTMIGQQQLNLATENLSILQKTRLITEQWESEASRNYIHPTDPFSSGAVEQERRLLLGQKCKLDAEFDLLKSDTLKSAAEVALLTQKNATEKAQTTALGVDDNSVIGKQKLLYAAQSAGFSRDAEQKAAKLMIDTWNVRRTSDPTTADVNANNKLTDPEIGRVVTKMLTGVGA